MRGTRGFEAVGVWGDDVGTEKCNNQLASGCRARQFRHGLPRPWHRRKAYPTHPTAQGRVERAFWGGGGGRERPWQQLWAADDRTGTLRARTATGLTPAHHGLEIEGDRAPYVLTQGDGRNE